MVKPLKRRGATLEVVKNIIKGVAYIKQQKQVANFDRLAKYMQRTYGLKYGETQREAHNAVEDNLLVSYTAVGNKGSKVGVEQEGFKIPDEESPVIDDGHDWYCFECHKPGEVLACSDCWRVYHTKCTQEEWGSDVKFICTVCQGGRKKNKLNKKYLNTLLAYTIMRLKEKTRELHRLVVKDEDETQWRRYIYRPRDLNSMEKELTKRKYHSIEEFLGDAKTILHNVILAFGEYSGMADLARIMIKDCKYDLDELRQCPSCYYMSNAKPKDWFCQICDPPHELVYAKQKGYSFWPAKVIRCMDEKYDVRFFGGYHQRAVVPKNYVKPISIGVRELAVKRTAGFVKACEELQKHQHLLEENEGKPMTGTEDESEDTDDTSEEEEDDEEEGEDTREVSSTSVMSSKQVPTPEDSNLVTSSEDKVTVPNLKVSTTSGHPPANKKSSEAKAVKTLSKHSQTDGESSGGSGSCSCEAQYNKIFSDFKERVRNDHKEDKDKAVKELSDRLHKDFEEDKQQAVSRAMANMQREIERVRRQTEEKCKEQYMEEMKKLAQKHKETISATKKKQWCFNCEEEAMYHCCWNTSYCSIKCQQEHWHKEHKRVCRRRR